MTALQFQLEKVARFLKPHIKFVNCHMVNHFLDDNWTSFIPKDVQNELLENEKVTDLLTRIMSNGYNTSLDDFPAVKKFINESKDHTLLNMPDLCFSLENLKEKLKYLGYNVRFKSSVEFKDFMSPKKNHEVELLSTVVADLCKEINNHNYSDVIVIDAGDGKGYLSSRLAFKFDLKVLGVDASPVNTKGAEKRKAKLDRAWNALMKKSGEAIEGNTKNRQDMYKTITLFIDETTNFVQLAKEHFSSKDTELFCLTGLHTCGNLAASCLKIYKTNNYIKLLCNVGCCYHLLVEEFSVDNFFNKKKYEINKSCLGFPLSSFLRKNKFLLGRNARMLASQSIHRFFSENEPPNITLFYRAILEILLSQKFDKQQRESFAFGKIKSNDFHEYVKSCYKKINLLNEIPSHEEIQQVQKEFEPKWERMKLYYVLRLFFAPIIETLIMLDRLLYLNENQLENSYIVKLFDPVISPRCYGIISIK